MNPWLRLIAVLVAAIAAALLLKVLPPIVVLVAFIGGVAAVNHVLKGRVVAEARGDEVAALGLRREEQDPFGLLGYPFALFARGREPEIEDLVWGTWRGLEVRRVVVSFEPIVAGVNPERPRFVCALALLPADLPHLVVEPLAFVTRLAAEVPMPVVPTGLHRLDEAFLVRCADAAFVGRFIDEPMATWIVALGEDLGFEVVGSLALLYGPASAAVDLVTTLETLQALLEHVPAVLPGAGQGSGPTSSDLPAIAPDRGAAP